MLLAYYVIKVFIIGLPLSFGIGGLIGYIVWKVSRSKRGKKIIIILSGITFIISQPISYIAEIMLDRFLFDVFFLVSFAIGFTVLVSILIMCLIIWRGNLRRRDLTD
ncbi:hypothetical protein EZS27_007812 [termite gut metagenome]|uniref:Uncharacterized protein n=1 Tax=termite gut metagenome TaxID=433724 RepID=A0A5J4SF93_9ZZZZ